MFIVKKFSPYYLEETGTKNVNQDGAQSRFLIRSRRAVDRLCTLRRTQIEQYVDREHERLRQSVESNSFIDENAIA